jgi:hypothetical protein
MAKDPGNPHSDLQSAVVEKADQTAFFHRTLELMDVLDRATDRAAMIMNVQLWVTGGHASTHEWYKKIGQRLCNLVYREELPDLTDQQRSALNEFMEKTGLDFQPRPAAAAGPTRRQGWIQNIFGRQ